MEQKDKRRQVIYIIAFIVTNIINGFLLTTTIFNKNLSPYNRTFFMVENYIMESSE